MVRLNGFGTAVAFLTRVPLRGAHDDLGRAAPWFPAVGALIGATVGLAYAGLSELVPATVAAASAVLFGVLLVYIVVKSFDVLRVLPKRLSFARGA